jgi:MYXO-CTERM domain-containing protein
MGFGASAVAAPLNFTQDYLGDYSGDSDVEIHAIGSKVEDGKLYFEVRTNFPSYGQWGQDSYDHTWFRPGDLFIAVGSEDPFDPAAAVHGIAVTSHDNVVRQAYPYETWDDVVKGRLYTDATFADGTFESYQHRMDHRGIPYAPDDQDGNDWVNSYPTLIKYGNEVSGVSQLSYSSASCCRPWDYEITGWVELDAIGLDCGSSYALFWSMECGNDGAEHGDTIICDKELPGELEILKFEDLDEDGLLDSGEGLLAGWEFEVDGPDGFFQTVTTGSDGTATLTDLDPGSYTITEILQTGWTLTTQSPFSVTVPSGGLATAEFGNHQTPPPIPEPAAATILLLGLVWARRRRRA